MSNNYSLHGTEPALKAATAQPEFGKPPSGKTLRGLNPDRKLDISTPRQIEISPAVFKDMKLVTPAVMSNWYVAVRVNDEGGPLVVPEGCTLSPKADNEPGFGEPMVSRTVSNSTPDKTPEVVVEPEWYEVSMAQARTVLAAQGLEDIITAKLKALPDGLQKIAAQKAWEYSGSIRYDSTLVANLWPLLELSEEQKVELFKAASKIAL